jgi:dihydrofolate reductase
MRKLVIFMHVTLDGFVAGPNGEMGWINVGEDMFEYAKRQTDRSDTALYGRKTFQMMEKYWPTAGDKSNASKHDIEHSEWYNNVDKVILSKTMAVENREKINIISDHLNVEINKIKQKSGKDIVIFGSPSAAHSLMAENLIDDYWLFVNPVLLGQGIPMFKDITKKINLNLVETKVFPSGVIALHYELKAE